MAAKRQFRPQQEHRRQRAVLLDTGPRDLWTDSNVADIPVVEIRSGTPHPNLFRKRLATVPPNVVPGDLVRVVTTEGQQMGFGFYNPSSEIALRMVRFGEELPDQAFWEERIRRAVELRKSLIDPKSTNAFRLIHAEGDLIPGIVVDKFENVMSAEVYSLAMYQRAESFIQLLMKYVDADHYVIQTSPSSETQEGFGAPARFSQGCPQRITIHENGTRFKLRFEGGHKTGFFCDQRDNRERLAALCKGKSMLDLCSYTGGFAVHAKKSGGASAATAVELDEHPLQLAKENANFNSVRVNFVESDVFPWMRDTIRNGKQFDVVCLDPPKLIRSRAEIEEGTRSHFDLNRLALQLVRPGGWMLTCCCAGLLSQADFERLVCGSARAPRTPSFQENAIEFKSREIQIVERTGPGPDHPIAGNCPESDYLKALWLRVY
jgi:23S rRNA (cytosine1962-C5)-methyltransferase